MSRHDWNSFWNLVWNFRNSWCWYSERGKLLFYEHRDSGYFSHSLNLSKCEAYIAGASSTPFVDELQSVAPGVRLLDSSEVTLLGFSITLDALPSSFQSKLGCSYSNSYFTLHDLLMMPFICCIIVFSSPNSFISCALLHPGGFLDF